MAVGAEAETTEKRGDQPIRLYFRGRSFKDSPVSRLFCAQQDLLGQKTLTEANKIITSPNLFFSQRRIQTPIQPNSHS